MTSKWENENEGKNLPQQFEASYFTQKGLYVGTLISELSLNTALSFVLVQEKMYVNLNKTIQTFWHLTLPLPAINVA